MKQPADPDVYRFMKLTGATLLLVLSVLGAPCSAIVAVERDFPDLVARAEQIVIATVGNIRAAETEEGGPFTYVTLDDVVSLKGDVGSTLTLRFYGGSSGEVTSRISDMPQLTPGERALLFIAGNGRVICPLVGIWQGRFRVRYDDASGAEVVEDHAGVAITGVENGQVQRRRGKRSQQPALTLNQFRQLVADELASPSR